MNIVAVDNLVKRYNEVLALDHFSLHIESGEVFGLLGPNGSGKTMLLRAICGFIHVDTGTVSMNGKSVEFNRKLPDSVGVIIENPGFVLSETGMQNLKYLAGINKDFDSDETERLLKEFGLWEHADEKMKSYSLGMRQKLAIVQALMEHQNLILLDEPTNGLDEQSVGVFLEEMRRQREQGKTVIIASHHRDELNLIADQFHSMASGRLHAA